MPPRRSNNTGAGDKESRRVNFLKKIFNGDQATKTLSFLKRKPTLKKKAMELETLCGIDVCIVFFDPNGNVDFWPDDESEVRRRCNFYMGLKKKEKKELNYVEFMKNKKKKLMKPKKKRDLDIDSVVSGLASWLNGLSGSELRESVSELESKIKGFKDKIDFLLIHKKQKEEEEEDCFSNLSSIQVLEGTNPNPRPASTRPVDFPYYPVPDQSFSTMNDYYNYNNNNNNNQILMVRNDDYQYENPMVQMQNYHMGLGVADQCSSINSNLYSSLTSDHRNNNYRRSHSIYDATPISQWPFNFGTHSGLQPSGTQMVQVDPSSIGGQFQQGIIRGQNQEW